MVLVQNKKARQLYTISSSITAGIVLTGAEVKSLRRKHASLQGSYVQVLNNEAWLLNAQINPYSYADNTEYDPKRSRKLLLTKKEIGTILQTTAQAGWVAVPTAIVLRGRFIKVEIGLGRGKKDFQRKRELKERDLKRELARQRKEVGF